LGKQVDGLIYMGHKNADDCVLNFHIQNPVVISSSLPDKQVGSVNIDYEGSKQKKQLLELLA